MANKILVTGANGTIGKPLVQTLQTLGADFEIMTSKPAPSSVAGVRVADFNDVAALTRAFTGIDTLFLLFPLVESKIELAHNAIRAAKAAGIKHIVRSSGAGANANSDFALPKLQGTIDEAIKASNIATTILCPAGFMQNYLTYQTQAIQAGQIYMADGGRSQSLIDAPDIAAVAAQVLINPAAHTGQTYTLTGGEAFTGAQAAAMLSSALGKPISHTSVPTQAAVETMQQWQMPTWLITLMDSLNHIVGAGYAAGVSPDVEKILGRQPIRFAQYVSEIVVPQLKSAK
jgi:uncharacterized protein YbjT (DUF2867 family)